MVVGRRPRVASEIGERLTGDDPGRERISGQATAEFGERQRTMSADEDHVAVPASPHRPRFRYENDVREHGERRRYL